jgi:hypothetical protein
MQSTANKLRVDLELYFFLTCHLRKQMELPFANSLSISHSSRFFFIFICYPCNGYALLFFFLGAKLVS